MKKQIVIVGGDAGAKIAAEIFAFKYDNIFYLETYAKGIAKNKIIGGKIRDSIAFLRKLGTDYFIATGDNKQRKENFDFIYKKINKNPVNCIHQTAYISKSATVGYGNLIGPGSIIHTEAVIGNNTIINTGSIVEHSCLVKDFAQISPNTTLCGYVEIGKFSFIGAGSVVIPKIKIGENSVVAAGSSVIDNIGDYKLYAGVPAKFKKNIK
jgi:acetyltransferase EpsM